MDASAIQPLQQPQSQGDPNQPPTDTPQEQTQGLPPALLKLHPIQALIAGTPPAISMPIEAFKKTPEAEEIVKNADQLKRAGMFFYKSLSGDTGVIGNALHIHPADVQAADKAGKLTQLAPPWNHLEHVIGKSGLNHPALLSKGVPQAPASPTPIAPPQSATGMVKPEPAKAQVKTQAARLLALQPGSPTSGPQPGGGRLINSILKPVI